MSGRKPWPPPGVPVDRDRMFLRGWTEVQLSPGKLLEATCCKSRRLWMRRRGELLTIRCADCGAVEMFPALVAENYRPVALRGEGESG